jgi:hypothetical protein
MRPESQIEPPATEPPAGSPAESPGPLVWPRALACGLLAGIASWVVGEVAQGRFEVVIKYPPGFATMNPYEQSAVRSNAERAGRTVADTKLTAVTLGALGACLGLCGSLARRDPRAAVVRAGIGALVGGAAVVAAVVVTVPLFHHYHTSEAGIWPALLAHLGLGAAVGAIGGLSLGTAIGKIAGVSRGLLGGLAGGILGMFAYEMIAASLYPLMRVETLIPSERFLRLALHLATAVLTAATAAAALDTSRRVSHPRRVS